MAVAPEAHRLDLAAEASETAEQLFQEHSGWIYGYCLRLLRSPEEAEDALQTTYLNACRSLGRGTRPQVGSAWLLRIAQNVCFARLRSSGRRGRLERVQDISFLEETVAAPERSPVELIGLTEALCSIPDRQREAILLREWQGLSYSEVGTRMDLSQAAVETLIFRARRSLAAALDEPEKRSRRKALHALDLGGLVAALKGFFAGAGLKTVAAIAVATATTATVVATDPTGVLRDRPAPSSERTGATEQPGPAASGPAAGLPPIASLPTTIVAPSETVSDRLPGQAGTGQAGGEPGAHGRANAEQAKDKGQGNGKAKSNAAGGNGNGRALGRTRQSGTAPGNGTVPPGSTKPKPASQGQGGPPQAPPENQGKGASKSH